MWLQVPPGDESIMTTVQSWNVTIAVCNAPPYCRINTTLPSETVLCSFKSPRPSLAIHAWIWLCSSEPLTTHTGVCVVGAPAGAQSNVPAATEIVTGISRTQLMALLGLTKPGLPNLPATEPLKDDAAKRKTQNWSNSTGIASRNVVVFWSLGWPSIPTEAATWPGVTLKSAVCRTVSVA